MGLNAYVAEVESDSPVSFWQMQETSGTTADDSQVAAHDGTYTNGPTLNQSGPAANVVAVDFDGSNDYVDIADHADFTPAGDFSVEAWVKNDAASPSAQFIVGKLTTGGDKEWSLSYDANGFEAVLWNTGGSAWEIANEGGTGTDATAWHHVVLVYDAGTTTLRVYVDGTEAGSDNTTSGSRTGNTTVNVNIGRRTSGNYWSGHIAMVAYYGSELSSTQVSDHYDAMFAIEPDSVDLGLGVPTPTISIVADIEATVVDLGLGVPSPTLHHTATSSAVDLGLAIGAPTVVLVVDRTIVPSPVAILGIPTPSVTTAGTQTVSLPLITF